MMTPNRPSALPALRRLRMNGNSNEMGTVELMHSKLRLSFLPKISTTRILTNSVEFWASDKAALLPTMPTHSLKAWSQC